MGGKTIKMRKKIRKKRKNKFKKIFIFLPILLIVMMSLRFCIVENNILANNEGVNLENRQYVICIDPGHGGSDIGASSLGYIEKKDTLELSLLVEKQLKKQGYTVVMTRKDDEETLSPSERAAFANNANADVLVSIHRNNFIEDPSINGVEAWISYTIPSNSKRLSEAILSEIEETNTMDNRGIKTGSTTNSEEDYTINKESDMASFILEMGFMSNSKDNKLLKNNKGKYAEAIANGIAKYFDEYQQ